MVFIQITTIYGVEILKSVILRSIFLLKSVILQD